MSKKEEFIKMVQSVIDYIEKEAHDPEEPIFYSKGALDYFEELKRSDYIAKETISKKVEITENGIKIIKYMQENYQKYNNVFTSKIIGEGIFLPSRSVSGSMKKLVADGFVEKIGSEPVAYAITDKGKDKDLSNI